MDNLQRYIPRQGGAELADSLRMNPVTAVIGPRQCGKSTLVRHELAGRRDALYLDLQLPSDARKLADAELFLREQSGRLVCLDEIQTRPDLFAVLRAMVDRDRRPGRYVVLGSASRDLIRRGGETLAGRIHYIELTPFRLPELPLPGGIVGPVLHRLWWRGGFPPAYLARDEESSRQWRTDLIQDYLSRDIPSLGFALAAPAMLRFWTMLAHYHGAILNASKLGQALDVAHNTIRRHLDVLEQTFMVRVLRPFEANLKKRLVKSPKVYIRDTGLLHVLLEIATPEALRGHPAFGASWEGFAMEQVLAAMPGWRASFYRTSSGEELDLILDRGARRLAFEFKASSAPHLSKGFPDTVRLLHPERTWVVCPLAGPGYPLAGNVRVAGLAEILKSLEKEHP
jgi:predicted AAA+ superfamily ATPase